MQIWRILHTAWFTFTKNTWNIDLTQRTLPRPLKKPSDNVWFSIGHNTLSTTVARVCKAGGINGYKTNHSLRVTTATRLFQKGIDEQLIMTRTGHRSIEGVRTYKRVSEEQTQGLSHILNDATNGAPATKKLREDVPAQLSDTTG